MSATILVIKGGDNMMDLDEAIQHCEEVAKERRINSIRAEQLAHALFGGECQIAFKDGKMLEKRCKGCVVIDIIRALPDGWQEAIEVKYLTVVLFETLMILPLH
jgi:hypothetical protein